MFFFGGGERWLSVACAESGFVADRTTAEHNQLCSTSNLQSALQSYCICLHSNPIVSSGVPGEVQGSSDPEQHG